jgi:hypothetical protein
MARKQKNLLDFIPRHKAGFIIDENKVSLVIPRFKAKWVQRMFINKAKSPTFKVKLDDMGSAIWLRIDGKRDITKIADDIKHLETLNNHNMSQIEERTAQFLLSLKNQGYIYLSEPNNQL